MASREDLIRQIYAQELGVLDPDPGGLDYWANQRTDLTADQLRPLIHSQNDRNELVRRLYYQELGRIKPDIEGWQYWANSGLDENTMRTRMREAAGLSGKNPAEDLLADQQYNTFLRKMQFDESEIQSGLVAAKEAARRRIDAQSGLYDQQRMQGARGVDDSFEARGMYRSGGRLKSLNENRMGIDRQQAQFESGIHSQSAEAERQAAGKIAEMRRNRAEQELAARDRLTLRSAGM